MSTEPTPTIPLGGTTFTVEDQEWFARASGDANPVHVDPVTARRTIFGGPVVHGVHLVCWALDAAARAGDATPSSRLRVDFRGPALLGEPVAAISTSGPSPTLHVRAAGRPAARLRLDRDGSTTSSAVVAPAPPGDADDPDPSTFDGLAGQEPLALDADDLASRYPALLATWGPGSVAALLAATRIVGMRCPGRRSVFVGLDLRRRDDDGPDEPVVDWSVRRWSPQLGVVELAVDSPDWSGTIRALLRPEPQDQPGVGELAALVTPGSWSDRRVLVVGGSRGLGEVAAKLVGLAGAEVVVGYARGRADAERVATELRSAGVAATAARIDAVDVDGRIELPGAAPTDVAYFAAPPLRLDREPAFSATTFERMSGVLVAGLGRVVTTLLAAGDGPLRVWHPSTTFLDHPEPGAAEYVACKAAAEAVLAQLAAEEPRLEVRSRRLPRAATDQTVGVAEEDRRAPGPMLADWLAT